MEFNCFTKVKDFFEFIDIFGNANMCIIIVIGLLFKCADFQ